MGRTISIGAQWFADIRERNCFLVDKTDFIRQWWRSGDQATLICRPRRFGKTLNMSMLECFFSQRYAGRADLFEGLEVWNDPTMHGEQGAWPVVFLSFAGVKSTDLAQALLSMCKQVAQAWRSLTPHVDVESLGEREQDLFAGRITEMSQNELPTALLRLCELLYEHTGKKAIVLLDEYDAPIQEAWVHGYWNEMVSVMRDLFNNTFKTNPFLERAVMTGVTRVSRESIFSDLNNLEVITTSSSKYATCFGFTEEEVFASMDEMGRSDRAGVKRWYDGFTFGDAGDIYNPWSITKYLESGELLPHWANTSGNALVSKLVREGEIEFKSDFETLLNGGTVTAVIDEQVVFGDLASRPEAIWSLLLAGGYLKVVSREIVEGDTRLTLKLTNFEIQKTFDTMVRRWFDCASSKYNGFVRALLRGDLREMNRYMNDVALATFSTFDAGNHPAESEPERFYHGLVLGLLVELRGRYRVTSNRESGYGRYDVMLEPLEDGLDGIVLEFKVLDAYDGERTLEDTVAAAHAQIEERRYTAALEERGVPAGRIRTYGFAFQGKHVLIG